MESVAGKLFANGFDAALKPTYFRNCIVWLKVEIQLCVIDKTLAEKTMEISKTGYVTGIKKEQKRTENRFYKYSVCFRSMRCRDTIIMTYIYYALLSSVMFSNTRMNLKREAVYD